MNIVKENAYFEESYHNIQKTNYFRESKFSIFLNFIKILI